MEINWQDIFYITASLTMVVVFIVCVWMIWFLFIASKLINNINKRARNWNSNVDKVRYLITNIESKILNFLLKILDKGSQNRQK